MKYIFLLLSAVLIFSLTACDNTSKSKTVKTEINETTTKSDSIGQETNDWETNLISYKIDNLSYFIPELYGEPVIEENENTKTACFYPEWGFITIQFTNQHIDLDNDKIIDETKLNIENSNGNNIWCDIVYSPDFKSNIMRGTYEIEIDDKIQYSKFAYVNTLSGNVKIEVTSFSSLDDAKYNYNQIWSKLYT